MRVIVFTSSPRGIHCIKKLKNNINLLKVIAPKSLFKEINKKVFYLCPSNINSKKFISYIKNLKPDLILVAGFGKIFSNEFINGIKCIWINLHAGSLPNMRGSSPLNWALIKNHKFIELNVIKVQNKIDSGDIILSKKIKINDDTTITELHELANYYFPKMVNASIEKFINGKYKFKKQSMNYSYFPKRFKDDGFILFDQENAKCIHNKIRALTDPYPNAFTFFKNKKINLVKSKLLKNPFYGEPGRIYEIKKNEILVCALDCSLWITTNHNFKNNDRYKKLATLKEIALQSYEN